MAFRTMYYRQCKVFPQGKPLKATYEWGKLYCMGAFDYEIDGHVVMNECHDCEKYVGNAPDKEGEKN